MRNYYDALGLDRNASPEELDQAINSHSPEHLIDEGDLLAILQDPQSGEQYKRLHLQYEAIAAAMQSQLANTADNSHSWDKRVVEFTPNNDTIEFNR